MVNENRTIRLTLEGLTRAARTSRPLRCVRSKMRGCQHSMAIMASASRAVQGPMALPIPVTGPGSGSSVTDRTHAKDRHVCATRPGDVQFRAAITEAMRYSADGWLSGRAIWQARTRQLLGAPSWGRNIINAFLVRGRQKPVSAPPRLPVPATEKLIQSRPLHRHRRTSA